MQKLIINAQHYPTSIEQDQRFFIRPRFFQSML